MFSITGTQSEECPGTPTTGFMAPLRYNGATPPSNQPAQQRSDQGMVQHVYARTPAAG